jgi:hypothetical protein
MKFEGFILLRIVPLKTVPSGLCELWQASFTLPKILLERKLCESVPWGSSPSSVIYAVSCERARRRPFSFIAYRCWSTKAGEADQLIETVSSKIPHKYQLSIRRLSLCGPQPPTSNTSNIIKKDN